MWMVFRPAQMLSVSLCPLHYGLFDLGPFNVGLTPHWAWTPLILARFKLSICHLPLYFGPFHFGLCASGCWVCLLAGCVAWLGAVCLDFTKHLLELNPFLHFHVHVAMQLRDPTKGHLTCA